MPNLLLVEQFKSTTILEKPSWITKPQGMRVWWLSICYRSFGAGTWYLLRLIIKNHSVLDPVGSTLANDCIPRCCWTLIPMNFKQPLTIDLPHASLCVWVYCETNLSSSSSDMLEYPKQHSTQIPPLVYVWSN